MEKGGLEPSGKPSHIAEEGRSCILEQRRVIMAVTQLDSGTLDKRSSRLLEQLAGCIRCPPTEAAHRSEPDPEVTQQLAPTREEPTEAESSEERGVEPDPNGLFGEPAEKRIVGGSLRTTPEDTVNGHAKCPRALGASIVSKTADFFTAWSRKTGSSW
jgi:hypothetical protein